MALARRSMRVRYTSMTEQNLMITNPIVHPKVAILASLLIGALAIAAFMLGPHTGQQIAEQSGFGHRDASSADAPDSPRLQPWRRGGSLYSTRRMPLLRRLSKRSAQSLRRNDLASARVLLDAEQLLHKDDPRITALQSELQAREEASGQVLAVEPTAAVAGTVALESFCNAIRGKSRTQSQRLLADPRTREQSPGIRGQ